MHHARRDSHTAGLATPTWFEIPFDVQVSFALFADSANLSQEGKLNILGVFDALQVATLPTVHPRAHLVLRIKGERSDVGSHTVTLRWISPSGVELWSSNGELNIGTPPAGVQSMDLPLIATIDLPLDTAGAYTMGIAVDDATRAEVPVHVRSGPAPLAPGGLLS
jgi:hypothetical protein